MKNEYFCVYLERFEGKLPDPKANSELRVIRGRQAVGKYLHDTAGHTLGVGSRAVIRKFLEIQEYTNFYVIPEEWEHGGITTIKVKKLTHEPQL